MRYIFIPILTFMLPAILLAQGPYTSQPNGFFTINEIRGCAPLTVVIDAPTCDGSVGCDVDFEGNNSFQSYPAFNTHTYTTPGVYTIRFVRGLQTDNIQVEVYDNTAPSFTVSACATNAVMVSVAESTYDQYIIDYDDGASSTVPGNGSDQHGFATPGNHTVAVRGRNLSSADNCTSASQTITTLATIPTPAIGLLEVLDNSSIRVQLNGTPGVRYRLEAALNSTATFQQIKTLLNVTADTVRNLRTDDNVYCFRVGAFDPCNNTVFYSNVICSTNFDLQVLNNENRLTWATVYPSAPPTVSAQSLTITPTNTGTSLTIANIPGQTYSDTDVNCGTEYCYRLAIVYTDNSRSLSMIKCGVAISNDIPATIPNVSAIVGDPGVTLTWDSDPAFTPAEFSVFRTNNGTSLLRKTAGFSATDSLYTPESGYCYQISYTDVCGNASEKSLVACPVALTARLGPANEVLLSWTAFAGWTGGVGTYMIDKYDQTGTLLTTIDAGNSTEYTDESEDFTNQVYVYRVRAVPNDAVVQESVSNRVTIIKNPNLFYPAAFTPNGDALNDIFNVYGQYIASFEMDIYNRWGELLYTTTDLEQGWDGSFRNAAMPEGTYVFVARITDLAGRSFEQSGSILLLKKK